MKFFERLIQKKQYYVKCTECGREITGNAIGSLTYNFQQHKCFKEIQNVKKDNVKCSVCNKIVLRAEIHHIDGNRSNNKSENLIPLCDYCHTSVHSKNRMNELNGERYLKISNLRKLYLKKFKEKIENDN